MIKPIRVRFKRTYKRSTLSKMLSAFGDSGSFRIWQVGQARRYPVVDSDGNKNFYSQIIQARGWFRDGRRL